jgi:uracil-DNA glycosylase
VSGSSFQQRKPFRVCFVGSNPAEASGGWGRGSEARSWKRLSRWIAAAGLSLEECSFANAAPAATKRNSTPLKRDRDVRALERLRHSVALVVGLGNLAQDALLEARVDFSPMPHPSGKNRQLNHAWYEDECVMRLATAVASARIKWEGNYPTAKRSPDGARQKGWELK